MHPFSYTQAEDAPGAVRAASPQPDSKFLAGGTNLVDLLKLNVETPAHLIDITTVPLTRIEALPGGGVRIGALVKNSDLAHDPLIQKQYPMLSEALLSGATAQLRNMATTGGNLLQRTRCYYFRDTAMPCNKRVPGSGCPSIDGYNRVNAVLGTSDHCIASNPSDMNVAMIALDAVIVTQGPKGVRRIPMTKFYLLPGDHPERENVLEHGELITAVELPALPFAAHSHYLKVRDRASYAFALASAAVALDVRAGTVHQARIALGGVGTAPWRSVDAEKALAGKPANSDSYKAAAEAALKGAKGYKDNQFKIELARRTLVRCLTIVGQTA